MPTVELNIRVPETAESAMDPAWLGQALAVVGGGRKVTSVVQTEFLRTTATKIRFTVTFEGSDERHAFCLKGLLDVDERTKKGGASCLREGDFYYKLAPKLDVRVPECVVSVVDRKNTQGVMIMRDLIAKGATFNSALEPFTPDQAAATLEQIAKLHLGSHLLKTSPETKPRLGDLAQATYTPEPVLQELLDGPRGVNLSTPVKNAGRLIAGMKALAERDLSRPQFLVHGDAHAGNSYVTAEGPGLIDWQVLQAAGWAIDVAYHLGAVLPTEVAEREERNLLDHYLSVMRGHGVSMPDRDEAWLQYREAVLYGYFMWAITRRVDPSIIVQFTDRLGKAVMRHESHALLGIA